MPNIVRAQAAKSTKRLAMVSAGPPVSDMTPSGSQRYKAFFEELARLGYVENQNLICFRFSAEARKGRYTPPRVRGRVPPWPIAVRSPGVLGHHTILAVPLIGAGEAIGAISLRRSEVRPF